MDKKIFIICFALSLGFYSFSQETANTYQPEEESSKSFKKENIFLGGSLALGYASYTFNVGATPEIGYTIAPWLDAGLAFNLNYQTVSANFYNGNTGVKTFNYGGGPFVRLYPINFLFLQGQFEHNWLSEKINYGGGSNQTFKFQSNSFLAGIGYSQRIIGQSSFYTALMIDLMTDRNSPYRDYNNAAIPILRAGFNFYLRPSRK